MPSLTHWFLKSSLIYLILTVLLGVMLEIPKLFDQVTSYQPISFLNALSGEPSPTASASISCGR